MTINEADTSKQSKKVAISTTVVATGSLPPKFSVYGSWGKFDIKDFLKMEYIQTTFSLSDEMIFGENRLAEILRPAREVFQSEQMDMDSILQRAINDYRVSKEIIPYLGGEDVTLSGLDRVSKSIRPRFFPNITVAIVPIEDSDSDTLEDVYPNLDVKGDAKFSVNDPFPCFESGNHYHKCVSYGEETDGTFCFRVMKKALIGENKDVVGWSPSSVKIEFSTKRCRLVIIDGQHRAMALLALARNRESGIWPSVAEPFKPFYEGKTISKENLRGIQIPLTIAWFPDLHEDSELVKTHNGSIKDACRALFTDINNNAITMDKTSQILLSDNDVTSSFTRFLMNKIFGSD